MTDTQTQPSQPAIDYMVRLLQMNPVQECDEIVEARSARLGQSKKPEASKTQEAHQAKAERRALLAQLESIRADFWTMPLEALQAALGKMNSHGYADLEAAVARLGIVASHRNEFRELADKRGFDGDFFVSLKEVLTRSPRDVAVLKEQVLSTFRNSTLRKRGRRMVKLVKRKLPAIYELEADWFDALCRQKAVGTLLVSSSGQGYVTTLVATEYNRKYWWFVWIALVMIGRFVTTRPDETRVAGPPYRTSSHLQPLPEQVPLYSPNVIRDNSPQRVVEPPRSSMFGVDKRIWEPLEPSYPSERSDTSNSRQPGVPEDLFPRSVIPDPTGPANKPDDRYSR